MMKNVQESPKTLSLTEARENLSELVSEAEYGRKSCVISRYGKPAAALVPFGIYQKLENRRARFFDRLRETQKRSSLSPKEAEALAREAVEAIRKS